VKYDSCKQKETKTPANIPEMFNSPNICYLHDKWVPVITVWHVLRLQTDKQSPVWRVDANILNKQSQTPKRSGSPSWGLGEVLTTPHRKNWFCYET